ncbi:conserved hypothetical protein [Vibrio crassostreae]|nr:conserved hypothetical protein [Vibrio crassostreae]CAK1963131.1 conserved hypothetical protein [Vibrio crassostreae]CAK1969429.1 conserved hypothetical protein [Vibrio crassostreae]CAK2687676.1 conserved hypothetical protein [Vibrio crassostreae]CAK2827023.1 conserved hypothetical protein [Vibrio crassostreae]
MNLDEFDWMFIVAVIFGAIASVLKELESIIGEGALNYVVIFLKIFAAILSISFAVLKFLKLKPYTILLGSNDFEEREQDGHKYYYFEIKKKKHKKGKSPSVFASLLNNDGSENGILMTPNTDPDGNISVTHAGLKLIDKKLKIVVKN